MSYAIILAVVPIDQYQGSDFVSDTNLRKGASLMRAVVHGQVSAKLGHALGREGKGVYWVRASLERAMWTLVPAQEPRWKPIERPAIGHRFTDHESPFKDPPIPGHCTGPHALPIGGYQVVLGLMIPPLTG